MINFNFKNKILYKLFGMMIVFFIILSVNVVSNAAEYLEDYMGYVTDDRYQEIWNILRNNPGKSIYLNYNVLNPNHYVFCLENGVNPYKERYYTISHEYKADDDYLAYILAAHTHDCETSEECYGKGTDEWHNWNNNVGYYKHANIRQNLIWYYVYYKANRNTSPIYRFGNRENYGTYTNRVKVSHIYNGEVKAYVDRQKKFGIKITDLSVDTGGKISFKVSGTFDSFIAQVNTGAGWKDAKFDKNSNGGFTITNTKVADPLNYNVSIRVKASIKKYEASYIILRRYWGQDFLVRHVNTKDVKRDTGWVTKTIDLITSPPPPEKINISMQKYIYAVNDTPLTDKDIYVSKYDVNKDGCVSRTELSDYMLLATGLPQKYNTFKTLNDLIISLEQNDRNGNDSFKYFTKNGKDYYITIPMIIDEDGSEINENLEDQKELLSVLDTREDKNQELANQMQDLYDEIINGDKEFYFNDAGDLKGGLFHAEGDGSKYKLKLNPKLYYVELDLLNEKDFSIFYEVIYENESLKLKEFYDQDSDNEIDVLKLIRITPTKVFLLLDLDIAGLRNEPDGKISAVDARELLRFITGDEELVIEEETGEDGEYTIKYVNTDSNNRAYNNREDLNSKINEENNKEPHKDAAFLHMIFKNDIPVEILPGDKVTYRIYVYNNNDQKIKQNAISIKDTLPNVNSIVSFIGAKDQDGNEITVSLDKNKITISNIELAPYESKYYDIEVVFNKNIDNGTYENYAEVICSEGYENTTEYRVKDKDFVVINSDEKYSVSLEKFANKVNGSNLKYNFDDIDLREEINDEVEGVEINNLGGTGLQLADGYTIDNSAVGNGSTLHDRSGKRYNNDATTGNDENNKNEWKLNNPVVVHNGDNVEFTIRLQNTGSLPIKVKQIYDTYSYTDNNKIDLVRATINGNGAVDQKNYSYKEDETNSETGTKKIIITFTDPVEINPGEYEDVTIEFLVRGSTEGNISTNKAGIQLITDALGNDIIDSDGEDNNHDMDFLKFIPKDISLQKFITKVNDKDVNGRENGIFENSDDAKKNPNKDINFTEFNKGNNPVNIIDGDIVTYKIKVYNNTAYTHENIKIKDTLSYEGSYEITSVNKKIFSKDRIMEDTVEDITADFKINEDCTYTIEIIPAGGSVEFEISIKYNDFTEGKYENKVEFVDNNITTGYRIVDKDFVIMQKKYQVSLEKFICQVNGNALVSDSNMLSYNCNTIKREEKVIYGDNEVKNIKENDPVQLEVGDTVTYKIILKNTGENTTYYGEIMNLIVEDNCPEGLQFSSLSGSNITNSNNRIFTYTGILDIKETTEFYITYDVLSTAQDKDIIENTATVSTQLQDENENNRIDSDGEWNNTDKDWIKIKPYKISLEKYVSKVNGRDYANRSGLAEYLTYDAASDYYIDKTETASEWARTCTFKYNHPVNVYNGDEVEYNIKVKNDGKTKIKIQYVKDNLPESGIKTNAGKEITLNNADFELMPGESRTFTTKVEINEPNISTLLITNHAYVTGFKNKNNFEVKDKTPYNNEDNDYVQLGGQRFISLSIEKVWVIPEGSEVVKPSEVQMQLYRNGQVVADGLVKLNDSNNWKFLWANLYEKDEYGNDYIYDVKEVNVPAGFVASYTREGNRIICTNTAGGGGGSPKEISVNVEKRWEYVPDGIPKPTEIKVHLYRNDEKIQEVELNEGNSWKHTWRGLPKFDSNNNEYSYTVYEVTRLSEYNIKNDIKKDDNSYRYIIKNQYDIDNPDIIIGGYVWNDKAFDKTENDYNAKMNKKELKLNGIKVYLYRSGVANAIAETVTNSSGYYGFSNSDIKKDVISQTHKQYIKAEMCPGTKRWSNNYYSYYVVFEYDGITYTSAFVGDTRIQNVFYDDNYKIDSNACEDNKLPEGEIANLGLVSREKFNENIDANRSKISYYTVNKRGYIPQSIHVVNQSMKSSTNKIDLSNLKNKNKDDQLKIEDQLKYVSLGLRGRDLFDLELTSEVNKVNIIVNGQEGEYDYNGSVKLRKADLEASTTEDMANVKLENSNTYCSRLDQRIRASDINPTDVYPSNPEIVDGNAKKYASEQAVQEVYVTYKITVHNTSNTNGKPTAITNYFDKNYEFIEAKASNGTILNDSVNTNPGLYNSVTINTSEMKMLSQGDTMDIYIKYKLTNSGIAELLNISEGNPLPTYNMAEITSYVTACSKNQTEYTRGLIDKDSAPNSVDKEEARTTGNEDNNLPTIGGSPTTVDYYFGGVNLNILKYEDDTFATPVLYFVYDDSTDRRTIRGTVFEDSISVDNNTKIKKGNGKKDDDEKVIYGATVKLIEVNKDNSIKEPSFITTTDEAGKFVFENVLPGYYILEYHYGDTENTVVIDKNSKSYNGEDFQATNNENLNTTDDFWYIYNEKDGYSTAKDNLDRRKAVSKNVFNFEETYMEALKKVRVAENLDTSVLTDLIKNTQMYAKTKKMLITVEKSSVDNGTIVQSRTYGKYIISNMNFGIAEVPITKVELKKRVLNFVITDSTGQNIIAKAKKDSDGVWKVEEGEVIGFDNFADISIEDQKLQGARLEVRYEISINLYVEKNFDNNNITKRTIAGLADFIDNNLSYNAKLDDNDKNWKVATYDEIQQKFKSNYSDDDLRINRLVNYGTVDQLGNKYSTIVMAKEDNPLLSATESAKVTLTLEKILSSTDSTLEDIINSAIEPFVYNNTVEITVYDYSNTIIDNVFQDKTRVRVDNADNSEISIPGIRFDKASSDRITIHPPTGDSSISTTYYIVAVISLAVLAIGIYGIKKFVIKK